MWAALCIGVLQLGLWLLLWAGTLHLVRLAIWGLLAPVVPERRVPSRQPPDASLPTITVQLPMFNERLVAEQAICAACALDWPVDKLQVQVLDDSIDDCAQVVQAVARAQRDQGFDVTVLHRSHRRGYKAGSLDDALRSAKGEFIAVLDADFVPPPDFLRYLLPHLLQDPTLGFVQGRWEFTNEHETLLTRIQALILRGLMLLEQPALTAQGRPVQFNGTGGIWRRSAIAAAGGWMADGERASLTEDMDLSFRARLAGYHGRLDESLAIPTELPSTMAAFRVQQQRWVGGGAQVLRSLLGKLASGRVQGRDAVTLLSHLVRHARQPYLALAIFWLPLRLLWSPDLPGGWGWPLMPDLWVPVTAFALAVVLYYLAAQRRCRRPLWPAVWRGLLLLPLSVGLSLSLTRALWRGITQPMQRAEFVRTPKQGPAGAPQHRYRSPPDRLALFELLLGVGHAGLAIWLLARGALLEATGVACLLSFGLLWVGAASLWNGK